MSFGGALDQVARATQRSGQTVARATRRGTPRPPRRVAQRPVPPQGVDQTTRSAAAQAQTPANRQRRRVATDVRTVGTAARQTGRASRRQVMHPDTRRIQQLSREAQEIQRNGPSRPSITPEQRVGISGFNPLAFAGMADDRRPWLTGLVQNAGREAVGMALGVPAAAQLIGQGLAYPAAAGIDFIAPEGSGLDRAARGFRENTEDAYQRAGTAIKDDYAYRYGPFFRGDFGEGFSRAYENPLATAFDVTGVGALAGRAPNVAARATARMTPTGSPLNTRARNYTSIMGPDEIDPLTSGVRERAGNRFRPPREMTVRAGEGADAGTRTVRVPQRPYSPNVMTRGVQKAATRVTRERLTPLADRVAERARGVEGASVPLRRQMAEGVTRPFSTQARVERHDARETREMILRRKMNEAALIADERQAYNRALRRLKKDTNEAGIATRAMNVDGLGMEGLATRLHLEGLLEPKPGVTLRQQLDIAASRMRQGITERRTPKAQGGRGEDVRADARQVERIAALPDDLLDLSSDTPRARRVREAVEAGRALDRKAQELEVESGVVSAGSAAERSSLATRILLGGSRDAERVVGDLRAAGREGDAAQVRESVVSREPEVQARRSELADADEEYGRLASREDRRAAAGRVAQTRRDIDEFGENLDWRVAAARQERDRKRAARNKAERRNRAATREAAAQAKTKATNRRKAAAADADRAPTARQAFAAGERAGTAKAATRTAPGARPGRDAPDIQGHPTTKRVTQARSALAEAHRSGDPAKVRAAQERLATAEAANRKAAEALARRVGEKDAPELAAIRASIASTRATYGVDRPSGSGAITAREIARAGGEVKVLRTLVARMEKAAEAIRAQVNKEARALGRDLRDERVAEAAKAAKPGSIYSGYHAGRASGLAREGGRTGDQAAELSLRRYRRNVHNPDLSVKTGGRGRNKYRRKNLDDHARDAIEMIERGMRDHPHLVSKAERDLLERSQTLDALDFNISMARQAADDLDGGGSTFGMGMSATERADALADARRAITESVSSLERAGVKNPLAGARRAAPSSTRPPQAGTKPITPRGERAVKQYFTPTGPTLAGRAERLRAKVTSDVDRAKRDAQRRIERADRPTRTRAGVSPAKASAFGREFDARAAGRRLNQAEAEARATRERYAQARAAEARANARPVTKAEEARLREATGLNRAERELEAAIRQVRSVSDEQPKALLRAHQRAREELAAIRNKRVGTPAKISAAANRRREARRALTDAEGRALKGALTDPVRPQLVGHDGVYIPHVRRPMRALKMPFASSRGMVGPKVPKRSKGILIGDGVIDWNPALLSRQAERATSNSVGTTSAAALSELVDMAAFVGENGLPIKGTRAIQIARSDPDQIALVNIDSLRKAIGKLDELEPGDALSPGYINDAVRAGRDMVMEVAESGPNSGQYIAVSKAAADEWRGVMKDPGNIISRFDKAQDWWKGTILALSPRWYLNSTLGMAMQYGLLTGVDIKAIRLANREGAIRKAVPTREAMNTNAEDIMGRRNARMADREITRLEKLRQGGFNVNNKMESWWRRAAYVSRARRALAREGVKVRGLSDAEFAQALVDMPESLARNITREMDLYMGEFRKFSPFEQTVMRRIFPFYSWLRVITKLTLHLPFRSPLRAQALMVLAKAGTMGINPEDYQRPYWDRGNLVFGPYRVRTQGFNPFATLAGFANALGEMGNGGGLSPVAREFGSWLTPSVSWFLQGYAGSNTFGNNVFSPDGPMGRPRINPITGDVQLTKRGMPWVDVILNTAIPGQAGPVRRALAAGESVYDTTSTLELLKFRLGYSTKKHEELFYERKRKPVNERVGPGASVSAAGGFLGVGVTRENARERERRFERQQRDARREARRREREED